MLNYSGIVEGMKSIIGLSMVDKFGDNYNFELFLPEGGSVAFNPVTGNYEMTSTSLVSYKARVKVQKNKRVGDIIGSDYNRIELIGYLVSPLNFADDLPFSMDAKILNDGSWLSGTFYRELILESELIEDFELGKVMGAKISGYFELKNNLNT